MYTSSTGIFMNNTVLLFFKSRLNILEKIIFMNNTVLLFFKSRLNILEKIMLVDNIG